MQIRAVSSSGKLGSYPGISKRFSAKTAFLDLTKFDFFQKFKILAPMESAGKFKPKYVLFLKKN